VQKYENGTNRVGSGRLYQIAAILGGHVSTLFGGSERAAKVTGSGLLELLAEPQSLRLARAFAKITDTSVRRPLLQLAEKFAGGRPMGARIGQTYSRRPARLRRLTQFALTNASATVSASDLRATIRHWADMASIRPTSTIR
jgi:hypothetical protein